MALEFILMDDSGGTPRKIVVDLHDTDQYTQVIKMGFAADGVTPVLVSASNPLPTTGPVTDTELRATPVEVRGNTTILRPTLATSTNAYAINDVVGGEVTLISLTRATTAGAVLNDLTLWSDDAFTPELDIMFFDADLSGGTYTDSGALTLSATDKGNILDIVTVETTDWRTIAGDTWCTKSGLGMALKGDGTQDLRMIIVTKTAFTMAGATNLTIKLGLIRD